MTPWLNDLLMIFIAGLLVLINGFFVGAEFADVDTIAGLMMARTDKLPAPGDRVELPGATVEVLEVKGPRTTRIRLTLSEPPPDQKGGKHD